MRDASSLILGQYRLPRAVVPECAWHCGENMLSAERLVTSIEAWLDRATATRRNY